MLEGTMRRYRMGMVNLAALGRTALGAAVVAGGLRGDAIAFGVEGDEAARTFAGARGLKPRVT
jgi:hypothetical protein